MDFKKKTFDGDGLTVANAADGGLKKTLTIPLFWKIDHRRGLDAADQMRRNQWRKNLPPDLDLDWQSIQFPSWLVIGAVKNGSRQRGCFNHFLAKILFQPDVFCVGLATTIPLLKNTSKPGKHFSKD